MIEKPPRRLKMVDLFKNLGKLVGSMDFLITEIGETIITKYKIIIQRRLKLVSLSFK